MSLWSWIIYSACHYPSMRDQAYLSVWDIPVAVGPTNLYAFFWVSPSIQQSAHPVSFSSLTIIADVLAQWYQSPPWDVHAIIVTWLSRTIIMTSFSLFCSIASLFTSTFCLKCLSIFWFIVSKCRWMTSSGALLSAVIADIGL